MSLHEVMIGGTLQADGTLQLDQNPNLSPGRITVVLRQESDPELPRDDPFWQRMQAIWAIPTTTADGGAASLAEVQRMRDEWDEHQRAIERLQDECHAKPQERRADLR